MNKPYTTIIIDDEPPARERLKRLLANFKDTFQVIVTAVDGLDGIEKIETLQPDLIFLDIEMPVMNGFEMLEKLDNIPIVIFCTAYDQYSLKAFETNSIDYLLKPVSLERLGQTVNKLKLFYKNDESQNILQLLKELSAQKEIKKMTSITVKKGNKLVFVKLEDIYFFKAEERHVIVCTNNENYLTEMSLTQLQEKLPNNFLRIHRGIIINKEFVKDIQTYFNSRFIFSLQDRNNTKLTSGRSYNQLIKEWVSI